MRNIEIVTLVFADGTRFKWDTHSFHDAQTAMKLQKKHGHPKEIIGDGKVASTLREKYRVFNANPEGYTLNVFGTAAELSDLSLKNITKKFEKVAKRLGFKG